MNILRLRSTVTRAAPSRVDREAGIITGFAVATVGEATGHDIELDSETIEQIVEHGNASANGIKSRFTHPNLSSDGMGTQIGRASNFRVDGDVARADLHLHRQATSAKRQDMISDVLDLAEEDPDSFGASIVARVEFEERKPAKKSDPEPLPVARIERLQAVDIVAEPAANESFFSEINPQNAAEIATLALDRMFGDLEEDDVRQIVEGFMDRYLSNKRTEPIPTPVKDVMKWRRRKLALTLAEIRGGI